jgi:hypothetical protein
VNPADPSTARLDIKNDVAFTMNVRIKGFTMNQNTYMNHLIRVCGEETIALADSGPLTYLLNTARGNPSSLADSVRY